MKIMAYTLGSSNPPRVSSDQDLEALATMIDDYFPFVPPAKDLIYFLDGDDVEEYFEKKTHRVELLVPADFWRDWQSGSTLFRLNRTSDGARIINFKRADGSEIGFGLSLVELKGLHRLLETEIIKEYNS